MLLSKENCIFAPTRDFKIDKSGDRHYDYDVDSYPELRDKKIKREEKLMDRMMNWKVSMTNKTTRITKKRERSMVNSIDNE